LYKLNLEEMESKGKGKGNGKGEGKGKGKRNARIFAFPVFSTLVFFVLHFFSLASP